MSLKIKRSKGVVDIDATSWFFYGPPKIGKTTLWTGFPEILGLVTSAREVKAQKADYVVIKDWKSAVEAVDHLISLKVREHQYIAIDVIDTVYSNCTVAVCKRLGIKHPSEAGYGKGVDSVDLEFKQWIHKLVASDYGLVFISHMQTKDVQSMGKTIVKTISTFPERARKIVLPLVANIGYVNMDSIKVKDPDTGKVRFKNKRMISFEPSEFLEAGSGDGMLPNFIPVQSTPQKTYKLMKSYYTGKRSK